MKSFVDDNDKIENDRTSYQKFENITTSIDDVLKEEYDKSINDIQKIDVSNFCETSEEETEIDEFKDNEKRIHMLFLVPNTIKSYTAYSIGFIKSVRYKQILKMCIVFPNKMVINVMSLEHCFTKKM